MDNSMTKESIEHRIVEYKARQQQLMHEFHIMEGAIQDCQYWLSNISEEDKTEETK